MDTTALQALLEEVTLYSRKIEAQQQQVATYVEQEQKIRKVYNETRKSMVSILKSHIFNFCLLIRNFTYTGTQYRSQERNQAGPTEFGEIQNSAR